MNNPHFATADSWEEAAALLVFTPLRLPDRPERAQPALRVFVRDHRHRDLDVADRTLEAHYGSFVFTQSRKPAGEARRWAIDVQYGQHPYEVSILGREGRACDLGPAPEPGDPDGRSPAVVVWHQDDMLFLVASDELNATVLIDIAQSLYR